MGERTARMLAPRVFAVAVFSILAAAPWACRKRQSEPQTQPAPASSPSQDTLPDNLSADVLRQVEEATVFIESRYRPVEKDRADLRDADYRTFSGSGVIVSRDGLILTNTHVVDPVHVFEPDASANVSPAKRALARRIYVLDAVEAWIHSGTPRTKRLAAQVLSTRDNPRDLALLRVRHIIPLPALPVADGLLDAARRPALRKTQKVWAVGFPLGRQVEEGLQTFDLKLNPNGPDISTRAGEVSALRHGDAGKIKAIEHSCNIEPGNSGGPLVNARGELVGLNTWGGPKMGYAIPLEVILEEFSGTLRLMGHRTVDDGRPARRTLVVEPSAEKDADAVFRTLDAAMAAARDGDIIELAEGEHNYRNRLVIDKSVWIRGAGAAKTNIRFVRDPSEPAGRYRMPVRVAGYLEISDLRTYAGFQFESMVGTEACVYRTDLAVTYVLDGSPNFTDCVPPSSYYFYNIQIRGAKAQPRFQRVQGHFEVEGAKPVFLACPCSFASVTAGAEPRVLGCFIAGWIPVRDAKGEYKHNFFPHSTNVSDTHGVSVTGASDALVEGNRFVGSNVYAEGRATIRGNYFEPRRGPSVRAEGKASLTVEGNYFYFPGLGATQAEIEKESSLRHLAREIPGSFAYGVLAKGSDVWVNLKDNVFTSRKTWARTLSAEDGARLDDDGGNQAQVVRPTEGPGIVGETED